MQTTYVVYNTRQIKEYTNANGVVVYQPHKEEEEERRRNLAENSRGGGGAKNE
jgi:hypothetical protein